jgi:hypothetical protein
VKLTFARRSSATALAVALLASAAACSSADAKSAPPPEKLPAASEFRAGTCRTAADSVLAVAKLAAQHRDAKEIPSADRKALTDRQNDLAKLQKTAEADVRKQLDALVVGIGFVRLRYASRSYDPKVMQEMDKSRKDLQRACVS